MKLKSAKQLDCIVDFGTMTCVDCGVEFDYANDINDNYFQTKCECEI